MADPRQTILLVFNADSPPDVFLFRRKTKRPAQHLFEPFRALGEHLKRMPLGRDHDAAHGFNVAVRNALLKKIAHGIHKHEFR